MRTVAGAALLTVALLAACAHEPRVAPTAPPRSDLFVVLPAKDGRVGAVTVTHGGEERVLDSPYAAARIREAGRLETGLATEKEVREVFGSALAAQPAPPVSFTLYFLEGADELTPDSKRLLDGVLAEIARRPSPEVVVIGHTDLVGIASYNDALSLRRAERVRNDLVRLGISADRIEAVGRGKREPLVPTAEGVAEPRNRRVEVRVR